VACAVAEDDESMKPYSGGIDGLLQENLKSDTAYIRDSFELTITEIADNGVLIP